MMMVFRTLMAVATTISALGCAHTGMLMPPSASDQPRYVTYFLLDGTSSGTDSVDRRFHDAINAALAAKGLIETKPSEAQLVLVVRVATADKRSSDAFYAMWGGWEKGSDTYNAGALVVDVFDAWTKRRVWHGFVPDAVAHGGARKFEKPVAAMFKHFTLPSPTDDRARLTADERMRIIFSPVPALLIQIDGEPVYRNVGESGLQRIANTRAFILRDEGLHYLRLGDRWLEADSLMGWWSIAGAAPPHADTVLQQAIDENEVYLFDVPTPTVYISTTPAALVVTNGEPQFARVAGTGLLRMTNTSMRVFKEPTDQQLYVAVAGGWYRAWTTNGPWQYASSADLPTDLLPFATAKD